MFAIWEERQIEGGESYKMIQNLVADDFDHLKRLLRGHGVNQHVPVDTNRVARVKDAVFVLYNA